VTAWRLTGALGVVKGRGRGLRVSARRRASAVAACPEAVEQESLAAWRALRVLLCRSTQLFRAARASASERRGEEYRLAMRSNGGWAAWSSVRGQRATEQHVRERKGAAVRVSGVDGHEAGDAGETFWLCDYTTRTGQPPRRRRPPPRPPRP
jgi:hypothetical protein